MDNQRIGYKSSTVDYTLKEYSDTPVHFLVPKQSDKDSNNNLTVEEVTSKVDVAVENPTFIEQVVAFEPRTIRENLFDASMIPVNYTECVSNAKVPAYQEESCVSYVDFELPKRCKEQVDFGPGLSPSGFTNSIICYRDCTKKRFITRVEYETKLKPKKFHDTCYVRPKYASKTYVSFLDHHVESTRKWYKTTVDVRPKTYTNTKVHNFEYLNGRVESAYQNGHQENGLDNDFDSYGNYNDNSNFYVDGDLDEPSYLKGSLSNGPSHSINGFQNGIHS